MNIHFFDENQTVSIDKVGGKGLSLISMTKLGLNVPFGFIITTDVWKEFHLLGALSEKSKTEILKALTRLEEECGALYGDTKNPLIISARSGARFSMPGMMETILDIGVTAKTLPALKKRMGVEAALSSYKQFLQMFGHTVLKIPNEYFVIEENKLDAKHSGVKLLNKLVAKFKKVITARHDIDLEDPYGMLFLCIESVFESFMSTGAIEYRNVAGIPHDIGTAVIIQRMVFGNLNENSGSAVVFSRNFETGESDLSGHYLINSQGENVVRGFSVPNEIHQLPPQFYNKILTIVRNIEKVVVKDVADIEITWEDFTDDKKLYVLQSRVAKVPAKFYFQLQSELVKDGVKTEEEVINRVTSDTVYSTSGAHLTISDENEKLCEGSPLFTGIGEGKVVSSVKAAKKQLRKSEDIVLFCTHFDPNDLELLTGENKLKALVTTEGGPSSHMGLVLNALNIPGIMGIAGAEMQADQKKITVNGKDISDGDMVTIDSYEGVVYRGKGTISIDEKSDFSARIIEKWERKYGIRNYWADFAVEDKMESVEAEFAKNIEISKQYDSKKAQQTFLINTCFNKDIAIYTDIIDSNDTLAVMTAVKAIHEEGKALWLRSAYSPDLLQSPYTSVDIASEPLDEVKDWFENAKSSKQYSKFGNYQQWLEQTVEGKKYTMNYALLPHDMQGKLDKNLGEEHFVCSMRVERDKTTKLIIDIFDGVPHTRVLGQKLPHEIMSLIVVSNKALPTKIGNYYYKVGANAFNAKKLADYKNDHAILKSLTDIGFSVSSEQSFVVGFNKLLENKQLTTDQVYDYIQPRKLRILEYVTDTILKKWWSKYDLVTRMWALNKLTGASVLEIQGRYSDDNKWCLIYGTKGEEEQSMLKR